MKCRSRRSCLKKRVNGRKKGNFSLSLSHSFSLFDSCSLSLRHPLPFLLQAHCGAHWSAAGFGYKTIQIFSRNHCRWPNAPSSLPQVWGDVHRPACPQRMRMGLSLPALSGGCADDMNELGCLLTAGGTGGSLGGGGEKAGGRGEGGGCLLMDINVIWIGIEVLSDGTGGAISRLIRDGSSLIHTELTVCLASGEWIKVSFSFILLFIRFSFNIVNVSFYIPFFASQTRTNQRLQFTFQ